MHATAAIRYTKGFHRGGLTPTCGFTHACNGRECGRIEAVNATVLPRGALRQFHGRVRLSREKDKTDPAPYTLHRALSMKRLKSHNGAPYPYTTQSCDNFRPVPLFFVIRSVRLWGVPSRRHKNSGKRKQSQSNTFAVVVIAVALDERSLYFISFPPVSQLVSAASNPTDQPPNPSASII